MNSEREKVGRLEAALRAVWRRPPPEPSGSPYREQAVLARIRSGPGAAPAANGEARFVWGFASAVAVATLALTLYAVWSGLSPVNTLESQVLEDPATVVVAQTVLD